MPVHAGSDRSPLAGLEGDTLWIVAEHGRRAGHVRKPRGQPARPREARRRLADRHCSHIPDDDPRERLREMGLRFNALVMRTIGTELLSERIDLDREER